MSTPDPLSQITGARPSTPQSWDPDQLDAAERIYRVGRDRGVPDDHIRAALSAGIVESGFRNVVGDQNLGPGNEAYGVLQQRPVAGWGSPRQVQDVDYAANKFYDAAGKVPQYRSPGHLAAQVQRPRADLRGRYDDELPKADELFAQFDASQDPLSKITPPKPTPSQGDPLSQITGPVTSPTQPGAPKRQPIAKPSQVAISTADADWHFGPIPVKQLTPKAYRVLQDAVEEDNRKKQSGQIIAPPSLAYQNDMRAKAGLPKLKYNRPVSEAGKDVDIEAPYYASDQPAKPLRNFNNGRTRQGAVLPSFAPKTGTVDVTEPFQFGENTNLRAQAARDVDAYINPQIGSEGGNYVAPDPKDREARIQGRMKQIASDSQQAELDRQEQVRASQSPLAKQIGSTLQAGETVIPNPAGGGVTAGLLKGAAAVGDVASGALDIVGRTAGLMSRTPQYRGQNAVTNAADWLRQKDNEIRSGAEQGAPQNENYPSQLIRAAGTGAGEAAVIVPTVMGLSALGLDAAALPVFNALGAEHKGLPGMYRAGTEGVIYHFGGNLTGKALGVLGNTLVWIGGPTALQLAQESTSAGDALRRLPHALAANAPMGIFAGMGSTKGESSPVEVKDGESVRPATVDDLPKIASKDLEVIPPERTGLITPFSRKANADSTIVENPAQNLPSNQATPVVPRETPQVAPKGKANNQELSAEQPNAGPTNPLDSFLASKPAGMREALEWGADAAIQDGHLSVFVDPEGATAADRAKIDAYTEVLRQRGYIVTGEQANLRSHTVQLLIAKAEPPQVGEVSNKELSPTGDKIDKVQNVSNERRQTDSPIPEGLDQRKGDRREDKATRKRVDEMTPEEMAIALHTSEITGGLNDRAYKDSTKKPIQVASDIDGLKYLNDQHNHTFGNAIIKAKADALAEANVEAYHLHGDEFASQFNTPEEARAGMDRANEILKNKEFTFELPDGSTKTVKGVGFSYETGSSYDEADVATDARKKANYAAGNTVRGERPPGLSESYSKGEQANQGEVVNQSDPLSQIEAPEEHHSNFQPRTDSGQFDGPPEIATGNWHARERDGQWAIVNPDGKEVSRVPDQKVAQNVVDEMRNQPGEQKLSLSQALKAQGGIAADDVNAGEWRGLSNKEAESSGIVSQTGKSEERMAQRLAEDGYGIGDWAQPTESQEGQSGVFDIDLNRFREAVRDDLSGKKQFSNQDEIDHEAEYRKYYQGQQDEHDSDQIVSLLENEQSGSLYDKIVEGTATQEDIDQFRRHANELEISPEAQDRLIASAREGGVQEAPGIPSETGPAVTDNGDQGGNVGRVTSVKNEVTKAERAERGLDDVRRSLSRTDQEIWDKARKDVESGIANPDQLAAEIVKKHRPLTDDETVQLLVRRTQLHNQQKAQEGAAEKALNSGDKLEAAKQAANIERTKALLALNEEADTHGGTQNARALRIRQLMAKEDYSLAAMERRQRIAKGDDLTVTERANIKEQADQIAKLTTELEKIKAAQEFTLTSDAVKKIVREERFKARSERRTVTRKILDDEADALTKQLAAVWKKKPDSTVQPMGLAALDPEGVATKLVLKLARNKIQKGFVEAEALVDAVHNQVSDAVDLTKRQVAEMISGYGKTSKPSEDPVEVKLRELKSIIASNLGTADILEKGIRPERRGMQRDKPTQAMRDAARKMREALKTQGIEVERSAVDPEMQQKSMMDAAKTRTKNRIEDLTKWISDGKRTVANKTEIIPDAELIALKAEKDRLQTVFDAIKDPDADRRTVENSLRAANKSIVELQKRIKSGDLQPVKTEAGPTSPELDAARAEQKMLREILGQMRADERKANAPAKDPFEVEARKLLSAHKALNTRLEKQASEYQKRIDEIKQTGKPYEAQPKKEPFQRSAAEKILEERVGRIKQEYEAENRKASITPIGWAGKLIVGTGRAAKLTYVGTLGKLASAATGRIATAPVEDIAGHGLSKVFPELFKGAGAEGLGSTPEAVQAVNATQYKGREGAGLLNDHIAGIERLWKSDTWRQTLNKLLSGKSQQDVLYGGKDAHETDFLGIPGRVHGTIKEPVRQVAFYRQFRRRLGNIAREGKQDILDPQVQMSAAIQAQNDAMRSIFMQRNPISDGFNQMIGSLERSGYGGKTLAFLARLEFPITRVPVNIVGEGLSYAFGGARAVAETAGRAVQGGGKGKRLNLNESFRQMTPEQKDTLIRAYKKGGLGLAMGVWGYMAPGVFGGFYQKGEKRDKDEPGFGEMKVFGHHIPAWAMHVPIFLPAQMGATFRRLVDAGEAKGNPDAALEALGGTGKGIAEQIPFYETPARFFTGMEGPRQASKFAGEQARGFIPGFLQEAAKRQDVNPQTGFPNTRTPEGSFGQRMAGTVKLGIPDTRLTHGFSRLTVPMNEKFQAADEKQSIVEGMRAGVIPDNAELKSQGFTSEQIREMQKDAKLSPFALRFHDAPADKSLDQFERMDPRQRSEVETQMAHKAFSLQQRAQYLLDNAKDADKQRRQDELNTLQQRFDKSGITPRDPKFDRATNAFRSNGFSRSAFK